MAQVRFWTWDPQVLRDEMKAAGVSVADLSVATGLSRWRLYKYADPNGDRVPTPKVVDIIADALAVGPTHPMRLPHKEAA